MLKTIVAALGLASLLGTGTSVFADGLERLPTTTRPVRYDLSITPDPEFLRFDGVAKIKFEVLRKTADVQLNLRDLEISSATLANGARAEVRYDEQRERVILSFGEPLRKGIHAMTIEYSGRVTENVDGIFRVDYRTTAGIKRMLFAHSCCINTARLVAPSWDEPDRKAIFVLELAIPPGLDAVGNMPVAAQSIRADGRKAVRFEPTPKMSSYLLFFAVGELERLARHGSTTEIGMVTQKGKAAQGNFALDASEAVLRYYDDYFAMPYPLPKLDQVAMPGSGSFGAMENWGSIFYFEPRLLLDPAQATQRDRVGIYTIVAHEVAHQWFGNLVTARWWEDIWLNEAFASWMEIKATAHFNPTWNVPLHAMEEKETALRLDAMRGTHPIVGKLETIEQAVIAFDSITYNKGSQIVSMIEAWMGEEPFRSAIRGYVRDHAYDNAMTEDLWRALDAAAGAASIRAIARDFTEQEGVPLIEVLSTRCDTDTHRSTISVRQRRFNLDTDAAPELRWRVPVAATVIGSDKVTRQVVRGDRPRDIQVAGCGPVKVNSGETGYFRTLYDSQSFTALSRELSRLPAIDQLGLLNDSFALAQGKYATFDRYLALADALTAESEPLLLQQFARAMEELYRLAAAGGDQQRIGEFVQRKFAPHLSHLGWTPRADESPNTGVLRGALIALLSEVGHVPTLAEARRRFDGATQEPSLIPSDLRKVVLDSIGAGADAAVFEQLRSRAEAATDSTEQRMYLLALANVADPVLAARAMELALGGLAPTTLLPPLLLAIAEHHPTLAYEFVIANFTTLAPRLETTQRTTFVPEVASLASDAALVPRLDVFADKYLAVQDRESVKRASSLILFRDRIRRIGLPQVIAWIERQSNVTSR